MTLTYLIKLLHRVVKDKPEKAYEQVYIHVSDLEELMERTDDCESPIPIAMIDDTIKGRLDINI